nr:cytochrome P450 [Agasicles hygrophila]
MTILLQVVYLFISFFVVYVTYRILKWQRMLNMVFKLPGPKRIPVVHNLVEMLSKSPVELLELIRQWSKAYGPVYVGAIMGQAAVNVCGPEDFETLSSSMKHISKGYIYNFLHPWLGKGLLTSTGTQWQQRRKILTPAFHFSILQEFTSVFNNEVDDLIERIRGEIDKPYTNVLPLMSHSTLNIIAETSFGTKLDPGNSEDEKYKKAIHSMGDILSYRSLRPWFKIQMVFDLFSSRSKENKMALKTLHDFTNRIIKKKTKTFTPFKISEDGSSKKKLVFLDLLLNAKVQKGDIDDEGVRDEVNTFMFEGHDTTSMALALSLLLLAEHREYQDMLYEEIVGVTGDSDRHPDFRELNDMKLMDRVVKECLRLYPSVPFISRALDCDTILGGFLIPKEVPIHIWIYDIHRNPKHWPDPEKFDPDRFLPENCVERHPYAYVPFSAGPRNCIGQKFAMLEIKTMLCGILKNFVVEPVDTRETIHFVPDLVLRPHNGILKLKFRLRKTYIIHQ